MWQCIFSNKQFENAQWRKVKQCWIVRTNLQSYLLTLRVGQKSNKCNRCDNAPFHTSNLVEKSQTMLICSLISWHSVGAKQRGSAVCKSTTPRHVAAIQSCVRVHVRHRGTSQQQQYNLLYVYVVVYVYVYVYDTEARRNRSNTILCKDSPYQRKEEEGEKTPS